MENTLLNRYRTNKELLSRIGTALVFVGFFTFLMARLIPTGSMINISSDAAEIWKSIISYGSGDMYPSYVLYKGFASIFPYVWLYKLALLFGTNEFLFVMCYHSLLFAYIVAFGIPRLVENLTDYKPRFWQKLLLGIVIYSFWNNYGVFTQLMVDLPSCAFFLMSMHAAGNISKANSTSSRYIYIVLTALLSGVITNISGQYSVAALVVIVYSVIQIWGVSKPQSIKWKRLLLFFGTAVGFVLIYMSVKFLNVWFDIAILTPIREGGAYIASAEAWMERALFYMLDIGRKFYGSDIYDPRGNAIVMSMYGPELGNELLEKAAAGGYGWTIPEYFKAVFSYPADFIMLYLNRAMVMISDDKGAGHLSSLIPCYTMIYLSVITCTKRLKKLRDIFNAKTLLALACFAAIIPTIVMTVEIRVTIGLQALLFGVAVAGPIVPEIAKSVYEGIKTIINDKSLKSLADAKFPWGFIGWIIFVLICLAYFGSLCAASDIGTACLYRW